jgi:hypothetical protein
LVGGKREGSRGGWGRKDRERGREFGREDGML